VLSQQPAQVGQRLPPSPNVPPLELELDDELLLLDDAEPELELDDELLLDTPELLELLDPPLLLLLPPPLLLLLLLPPPELLLLPVTAPLDEPVAGPESPSSPAAGPLSTGLRPPVAHAAPTKRTKR
jgi:hypothetical protein